MLLSASRVGTLSASSARAVGSKGTAFLAVKRLKQLSLSINLSVAKISKVLIIHTGWGR